MRPFVDRPVTDQAGARDAARVALRAWGVPGDPTPIRTGMNALFGVPGEAVVVRVGHATAPAVAAHALVAALMGAGIATASPVAGWALDVGDFAVTGWERVRESRMAVRWELVGAAVRAVHDLPIGVVPDDYPCASPSGFPWWDFDALLAEVSADLDTPARRGIMAAVDAHRGWVAAVDAGSVVCHGDVHPGNVLVTSRVPLLMDWDLLCRANPAWDHAALLVWAERWGGDPSVYPRFADGYGRSFADDPLAVALGTLRNVAATLMRVRAGRSDRAAATEAERRLRYWRGDVDAPIWTAQ